MHHTMRRLVLLGILFALLPVVPAHAHSSADLNWQTSSQCWQTGQLGAESFACDNAAEPDYLATHTIKNLDGQETYDLTASGHDCSYTGLNEGFSADPQEFKTSTIQHRKVIINTGTNTATPVSRGRLGPNP